MNIVREFVVLGRVSAVDLPFTTLDVNDRFDAC